MKIAVSHVPHVNADLPTLLQADVDADVSLIASLELADQREWSSVTTAAALIRL